LRRTLSIDAADCIPIKGECGCSYIQLKDNGHHALARFHATARIPILDSARSTDTSCRILQMPGARSIRGRSRIATARASTSPNIQRTNIGLTFRRRRYSFLEASAVPPERTPDTNGLF
jgi:hypothetical protein